MVLLPVVNKKTHNHKQKKCGYVFKNLYKFHIHLIFSKKKASLQIGKIVIPLKRLGLEKNKFYTQPFASLHHF